jgi:LytS/YehU family sensor histidine kinase
MIRSVTTGYRFRITFTSWWLAWIVVQAIVISGYHVSLSKAFADSLLCNLLLAACCLLITNNMKYYLPQKERYWYVLIMSGVLSGLWLFLVKSILKLLYSTDKRKEQAEQMTKDAELLQLRQQLQPHFLFNSLNSISALAGKQPEKARHMIQQLSDFLRGTLKREEYQSVTLEEELHHLQLYLEIEKVRFGQRLQTDIQVTESAAKMRIPSLLLQPIVENAIKFGLYDTIGEVMITLLAAEENHQLRLTITNPFDEETAITTQGTGFGLASIHRRLYLLFARNDLLKTSRTGIIFTTSLLIPQYKYESSNH